MTIEDSRRLANSDRADHHDEVGHRVSTVPNADGYVWCSDCATSVILPTVDEVFDL